MKWGQMDCCACPGLSWRLAGVMCVDPGLPLA